MEVKSHDRTSDKEALNLPSKNRKQSCCVECPPEKAVRIDLGAKNVQYLYRMYHT
jgi:hypothetical protein